MAWGSLDQATLERAPGEQDERMSAAEAAWLAAVPCALALVVAVLLLTDPVSGVLYPSRPTIELLPDDPGSLTPEPLEGTRYVIALLGPLLLALATVVLARARPRLDAHRRTQLIVATQVLVLALVAVCFAGQHAARWTLQYFTFTTLGVAALLTAGLALAWPYAPRLREPLRRRERSRGLRMACGALALAAAVVWLLPGVNTEASINWSVLQYDMAFQFDETFSVINGLTPLADFNAQYASLFPYLIAAAMLAFGKTLLVFTLAVCALSVLALVAVYDVLRRAAHSSLVAVLLFVPFLATSMFNPEGLPFSRFSAGSYFPMFPFRYGGAYLLAWLVAQHLERGRQARLWLVFVAAGLVLLNNFEFGVAAFGATLVTLLVTHVERRRPPLLRLAGSVALGLGVALAAFSTLTLVRAGSLPDVGAMPGYSRLYAVAGYSVAPMPGLIGLPLVIYLTFVAAIGTAVVRALERAPNRVLTGMLAWSGTFGFGAASYYVARSDWSQMPLAFSAWMLALSLLALVVLEGALAGGSRRPGLPALAVLFGIGLAACSLGQSPLPWAEVARIERPPAQMTPIPVERSWSGQPTRAPAERRFIASTPDRDGRFVVRHGAPIALFVTTGHRIADAYGVVDVVPFTGPESMHTLDQLENALDALREAGGTTVLLQHERVEGLHRALERRGFRILTHHGVRRSPIGVGVPPDAVVVDGLTKWVDTTRAAMG
jgi:hypothetical protein